MNSRSCILPVERVRKRNRPVADVRPYVPRRWLLRRKLGTSTDKERLVLQQASMISRRRPSADWSVFAQALEPRWVGRRTLTAAAAPPCPRTGAAHVWGSYCEVQEEKPRAGAYS